MKYTQVKLTHANKEKVCFIPSRYAKVGKLLKLRKQADSWLVTDRYSTVDIEELDYLEVTQRNYKHLLGLDE